MDGLDEAADGSIHTYAKMFDPARPKGNTWATPTSTMAVYIEGSQAALDIQTEDMRTFVGNYPCTRELPQSFFDLMATDLDGMLAIDYRGYIRREVKPVLELVKDIIGAHLSTVELPPNQWLIDFFPGHGKPDAPTTYVDTTVGYARAWDRVLSTWDEGRLEMLFPACHMMPLRGLKQLMNW